MIVAGLVKLQESAQMQKQEQLENLNHIQTYNILVKKLADDIISSDKVLRNKV